jgi:hypothetical protein
VECKERLPAVAHRIAIERGKKINLEFLKNVECEAPTIDMLLHATRYGSPQVLNYLLEEDETISHAEKRKMKNAQYLFAHGCDEEQVQKISQGEWPDVETPHPYLDHFLPNFSKILSEEQWAEIGKMLYEENGNQGFHTMYFG